MLSLLRRLKSRVLGPGSASYEDGMDHELGFWRRALADQGKRWDKGAFAFRTDPDAAFHQQHRDFIGSSAAADRTSLRVLDVGAGPLTTLGKKWPGRTLEIVAVDCLAESFDRVLGELGIVPPVRTTKAFGEELSATFAKDSFDFVASANAIDHSRDPMRCVLEMVEVVKPGCVVFLWHYRNEAVREGFAGMHQWNFDEEGGDLVITGRDRRPRSCRAELAGIATIECRRDGKSGEAVAAVIRKRA
jgi:SAM-dependent methyltransferase